MTDIHRPGSYTAAAEISIYKSASTAAGIDRNLDNFVINLHFMMNTWVCIKSGLLQSC